MSDDEMSKLKSLDKLFDGRHVESLLNYFRYLRQIR
jgi:hypothetical protein